MFSEKKTGIILFKVFSFLFILTVLPCSLFAEKLTVAYTGNSFSSLYPCGACPASVGGGLTRRATALKQIEDQDNLLIIDAGNFTGGGIFDPKNLSPLEDRKRTSYNYQAMQTMGYEAVGLGINEFALGQDFLESAIRQFNFKFVSSNLSIEGASPYYLREIAGLKVGIIGLSSKDIYKEYGIEVGDYEESLQKVLADLKNKCSIIILFSSIDEHTALKLIKKFPQVNIVISTGPTINTNSVEKVNETIFLRPRHEAKSLSILSLETKNGKIVDFRQNDQKLSLEIKEDLAIKKLIPTCFSDQDCRSRQGLVKKCQAPGEPTSNCAYYAAEKIDAIIVTDTSCSVCSTELTEKILKDKILGINFQRIDYRDKKAKDLTKRYKAKTLPLFVIDKKVDQEKSFDILSKSFIEHEDNYTLAPNLSGLFMFLNRKETEKKLDLFVDFYERGSQDIYDKLAKFTSDNGIDLKIYFIISKDKTKAYPLEEVKVALAIAKISPKKLNAYVSLRLRQVDQSSWVTTLDEIGVDYRKIQAELKSARMNKLLENNSKLVKELGIREGNVILINNNKIYKTFGVKDALLKKMFNL